MASLKEIKNRLNSVTSTKKLTGAMKIVAAARLKKARNMKQSSYEYAKAMGRMIAQIRIASSELGKDYPLLLNEDSLDKTHLLVVFSSERGLCGPLNNYLNKYLEQKISSLKSEGKEVKIICVGKKGFDYLYKRYKDLVIDYHLGLTNVEFRNATKVSEKIIKRFNNKEFDVCHLVGNQFVSLVNQSPTSAQIIPMAVEEVDKEEVGEAKFEFEPNQHDILTDLIPKNITLQIYQSMLENNVCELAARMTAMDSATRNADELVKRLKIQYNRSRQAKITTELIEIIAGAESSA